MPGPCAHAAIAVLAHNILISLSYLPPQPLYKYSLASVKPFLSTLTFTPSESFQINDADHHSGDSPIDSTQPQWEESSVLLMLLLLASIFPDGIDKPLYYGGVCRCTRTYGHTLLFCVTFSTLGKSSPLFCRVVP